MKKAKTFTINKLIIWAVVDIFLYLLFRYYQPFCEPCLSNDCPPCLSEEQYFIIYLAVGFNVIYFLYLIFRMKKDPNC